MSEWKEFLVNDLIKLGYLEKPLDGNHGGIHPKGEDFITQGVPFIMASDIKNGKIDFINCKFIAKHQADKLRKGFAIEGDVLLTHKATIGRTAIVPNILGDYIMLTPQVTYYRVKDYLSISNKYLKYYFDSPYFQDTLVNHADAGSTRAYIGITAQLNLPIILPPLPEQKAIADVLSSLDDKIDLLQRQNETLEKMAETLFRQWFIEEAKDDWEEGNLSQLISFQNGYAFKSKHFSDTGVFHVIKIKNISGNIVDLNQSEFILDNIAQTISNNFLITSGDVLIAMTGAEIGKLGIVPKTSKKLLLNQRVGNLRANFKGSNYLAYLHLKSEFGQDYIINSATGSAQPNISNTQIVSCSFPKLPKNELIHKSHQINVYFEKIVVNMEQIQTLQKLRDTLLPKLMSGEIRVKLD